MGTLTGEDYSDCPDAFRVWEPSCYKISPACPSKPKPTCCSACSGLFGGYTWQAPLCGRMVSDTWRIDAAELAAELWAWDCVLAQGREQGLRAPLLLLLLVRWPYSRSISPAASLHQCWRLEGSQATPGPS